MKQLFYVFIGLMSWSVCAQLSDSQIDKLVINTLETFEVPGISVGVYKDGQVVYAKGHGVRSLEFGKKMDAQTLVGVASNSKGFTCFALAMLVDEGKLKWDDQVRYYIPEFQLHDSWATEQFSIRDLVTHRSGLGLGAGDLMFFPEGGKFSVQDIINNLKYLEPKSSFRSTFEYNNLMFIVAGEVIKRVSGFSWEEFIEQRILKPVGMIHSSASYNRVTDRSNIIEAHTRADGKVVQIPHDWSPVANAAGGIVSNVSDMLKWAQFLMNDAVTKEGERLLSKDGFRELWQLQMPLNVRPDDPYHSNFRGYGLGWFVSDVKGGYKQVSHTGGLLGTVTQFTMIPELDLAIVVLTNQMVGSAFNAITNTIKDAYLGYDQRPWLETYGERHQKYLAYNDSLKVAVYKQSASMANSPLLPDPQQIVGTYSDDWFGDIIIEELDSDYSIKCENSPRLVGRMLPYNATTYVAKWNDRSFDADVFVKFVFDETGKATGATMSYIAPITDFSFDFHDLQLVRTN
jgi:CubicO group peptidase (beta-lactamase class C family)